MEHLDSLFLAQMQLLQLPPFDNLITQMNLLCSGFVCIGDVEPICVEVII